MVGRRRLIACASDASVDTGGFRMIERADSLAEPARADAGEAEAGRAAIESSEPRDHTDHVPRGIGCMVLATMLFSTASAMTKWQVGIYPVGEVVFSRSISSLVVCAAVMLPMTGFSVYVTRRPRDHFARGLSQATSQTLGSRRCREGTDRCRSPARC